jgi:hypothetical protein
MAANHRLSFDEYAQGAIFLRCRAHSPETKRCVRAAPAARSQMRQELPNTNRSLGSSSSAETNGQESAINGP